MKRIFFLLLGLIILGSCGDEPAQQETQNWKRTSNEVILRLDESPDRLNPMLATTAYATEVNMQLFFLPVIHKSQNTGVYSPTGQVLAGGKSCS
jgi:hypothetical protein